MDTQPSVVRSELITSGTTRNSDEDGEGLTDVHQEEADRLYENLSWKEREISELKSTVEELTKRLDEAVNRAEVEVLRAREEIREELASQQRRFEQQRSRESARYDEWVKDLKDKHLDRLHEQITALQRTSEMLTSNHGTVSLTSPASMSAVLPTLLSTAAPRTAVTTMVSTPPASMSVALPTLMGSTIPRISPSTVDSTPVYMSTGTVATINSTRTSDSSVYLGLV